MPVFWAVVEDVKRKARQRFSETVKVANLLDRAIHIISKIASFSFALTPINIVFAETGYEVTHKGQTPIIREGTIASMNLSHRFVGNIAQI
ncbi:hypothetical protein BPOR_0079g00110 [Botrytis porri]|uniref:Uncharacterized protein n=1 Tax=Botrytis porri TaxID=87229 RepID=A0A4Z1KZY7_9HELO|nr:hypothetical protein BPOR_0079g00110 [Botrytis porri]